MSSPFLLARPPFSIKCSIGSCQSSRCPSGCDLSSSGNVPPDRTEFLATSISLIFYRPRISLHLDHRWSDRLFKSFSQVCIIHCEHTSHILNTFSYLCRSTLQEAKDLTCLPIERLIIAIDLYLSRVLLSPSTFTYRASYYRHLYERIPKVTNIYPSETTCRSRRF